MNWRSRIVPYFVAAPVAVMAMSGNAESQAPRRENNSDKITLVVPAFFSEPPQLGLSVMTTLQLQIWRTLRKEPDRNPGNLSFGDGEALWDDKTPQAPTHEAAAKVDPSAQMILWGKAYALGSGASVLAYLTLPDTKDSRKRHFERWALTVPGVDRDQNLVAEIPARQYAFEPIVLADRIISAYSSIDALKLYDRSSGGRQIGTIDQDADLFALEQADNAIRVRSGRLVGWFHLTELSDAPTEVVDFVGGLMRIFRADWDGAVSLLSRVVENPATPTALRVDTYLLMGHADYELGREFESHLRKAEELDRYAVRVVRYRVMGMIAQLRNAAARRRSEIAAATKEYLEARAHLFPPDDPWLRASRDLLAALAPR